MRMMIIAAWCAAWCATGGRLAAQGIITPPAPPDKPEVPVAVHADVGYVNTSGNTQVATLNVTDALTIHTSHVNKIQQTFGVVYGTNRNRVETNLWTAGVRDEYAFTKHVGVYALVGFDRNTFAGIDRRFEEGGGLALVPFDDTRHRVEVDAGASYIEQRSLPDSIDNHVAARGAVQYRYTFGKDTYADLGVEGLPNLQRGPDYRINSQADLVAPLSRHIALKLGYGIRYANLPPPGFKTTDRLFTSDVQVTF
jgi:putative salt-induced outer membrane protein